MEWSDAIAGAVAGALLTAAGFIYKRRLENLAVLKKSLYQLLILHRSVNSATLVRASEVAKWVVETLNEAIPGAECNESMKGAESLYGKFLNSLIDAAIRPTEQNLVPMYLETVENISAIDPVLAYRLSGNAALKRYLIAVDQETHRMREMAAQELSQKDMAFVERMHSDASIEISKEVIRELRSDLLLLSLKCGIFQFIGVVRRVFAKPATTDEVKIQTKAVMKALLEKALDASRRVA